MSSDDAALARILQRYSTCDTYADSGSITLDFKHDEPKSRSFKTHFVRPDRLLFVIDADNPAEELVLWVKGATVFECTRRGSKRLKRGLFEFQYESRRDDLIWFSAVPFLLPELRTTSMYLKNRFVTLEHEPEQTFELVAECIPYAKIQISGSMTDWSINEITATHEIGLGRIHVGSRVNVRFDQISFNEPISDEYFKFEPRERQEE